MIKLTLEEYHAMPKEERRLLRRLAFGAPRPALFTPIHDLDDLRTKLVQENEATCVMPKKWTEEGETLEEILADAAANVDVVDQMGGLS